MQSEKLPSQTFVVSLILQCSGDDYDDISED